MGEPVPFRPRARPAPAAPLPDTRAALDVLQESLRLRPGAAPEPAGTPRAMLVSLAARALLALEAYDREHADG